MANTKSIDLELDSAQFLSRVNSSLSTGFPGKSADGSSEDLSIIAWIKSESLTGTREICTKGTATGNDRSFRFTLLSSGKLELYITDDGSDGGANLFQTDNSEISTGTWFHVAMTFDISAETCVFYVDGSPVDTSRTFGTSFGANYNLSSGLFQIGSRDSGTTNFDGLIDEVGIYDAFLSAGTISSDWNSGNGTDRNSGESNIQGGWRFEDDLLDVTANDNDLTNNNSATFSADVPFSGSGSPYTLEADTMAMVLTYNAVLLKATRKLVADTMAMILTFADVILTGPGATLVVDTMAMVLTYNAVLFKRALSLVVDTMAFTLTFNAVNFVYTRALTLVVNTMAMILTFFDVDFKVPGKWVNSTKNTSSWTNNTKN